MAIVVDTAVFGGAEVYVDLLLRHLPTTIPRILVVRAPGPRQLLQTAAEQGIEVISWTSDARGLVRLDGAIRTAGLVHLNLAWPGANREAAALTALHRRPSIATVHLYIPPRTRLRRRILRLAFGRLGAVIVVSRPIQRSVQSDLDVPPGSVRLVPNGVLPQDVATSESPSDRQVVRIGAVGRLSTQKGFDLLLTATQTLVTEGRCIEVSIAGDGQERASLEEAARSLPVRLVGPITDIQGFLSELDVFCLPSRWEGLPFALLEAMMAGKACVATDVGDVAEALGPAGLIVVPENAAALAEALGTLVEAPEQRRLLGSAARQRATESYTIDRMIERTAGVYREILSDR